jgi:membrane peptidoglycan carboxypeptidase
MPKDDILSLYLNEVPYGGNTYGIQEAAQEFFGKDAADLDLAESAYLAALPQAPTYYSPYGSHRDALDARKNLVLDQMLSNDFITQEEHDAARQETVTFLPRPEKGLLAPHFVFYIRQYLSEKYGESALQNDGLKVITTLDYDLQKKAEQIIHDGALKNEADFKASNAGLVAIDPTTGQILVMVGSRDYFDTKVDGSVNIALAHRQPGSTFKPFVYATAFEKGLTPDTVLFDLPTQFSTACAADSHSDEPPCYYPEDFDGKFRGPMTIRNALAQSINIPAVKALYIAGVSDSMQTARNAGITTLTDPGRYGLTLVLGGGEVTLLDLTSAYGVFANDGVRNPTTAILKVERADGTVLEEYAPRSARVIDENISREITSILSDNVARTPEFGERSPLYFPGRDVAAKTGTTNDYRDVWTIGYTPNLVVGIWGGNNDNTPIVKQIAGFVIAPLWRQFMDVALPTRPTEQFLSYTPPPEPKPVLAGIWQGGDVERTSAAQTTVTKSVHSILNWINTDDILGPAPKNPASDPQYTRWEYPVRIWAAQNGYTDGGSVTLPISLSAGPSDASSAALRISGLEDSYAKNDTVRVSLSPLSPETISYIEVLVNNTVIQKVYPSNLFVSFSIKNVPTIGKTNTLSLVVHEIFGETTTVSRSFTVRE